MIQVSAMNQHRTGTKCTTRSHLHSWAVGLLDTAIVSHLQCDMLLIHFQRTDFSACVPYAVSCHHYNPERCSACLKHLIDPLQEGCMVHKQWWPFWSSRSGFTLTCQTTKKFPSGCLDLAAQNWALLAFVGRAVLHPVCMLVGAKPAIMDRCWSEVVKYVPFEIPTGSLLTTLMPALGFVLFCGKM